MIYVNHLDRMVAFYESALHLKPVAGESARRKLHQAGI
jgi:hypothetical protein